MGQKISLIHHLVYLYEKTNQILIFYYHLIYELFLNLLIHLIFYKENFFDNPLILKLHLKIIFLIEIYLINY